jgi:hypothetical protein
MNLIVENFRASNALQFGFWDSTKDAAKIDCKLSGDCQDNIRPLLEAVRDRGVLLAVIVPGCGTFQIPVDRQAIVLIDDSISLGPLTFDEGSIAAFLKRCEGPAFIVSSAPLIAYHSETVRAERAKQRAKALVPCFRDAADAAVSRTESVLLIETSPEWHDAWRELIERISPRLKGQIVLNDGAA